MEKYSKWRDPATGVAPFLTPLPTATDALPPAARVIALPLAWLLGGIRTGLVLLLLLLQAVIVDGVFSICLVIPPLHSVLSRVLTSIFARAVLFLLGFVWIPAETATLKRTGRTPPAIPFAPQSGDVIVANSSSYIDILYLAFKYDPVFLLPVSSTGSTSPAKITSWRRVGLLSAIFASGRLPERSERGETFAEAVKKARGPVVLFPECTTSNNRALLRFPELLAPPSSSKPTPLRAFVLSFKYPTPTRVAPSATHPIPSSAFSPLPHLFSLACSPSPLSLTIRRLHPSESPKITTHLRKEEWESLAEVLAAIGRWKRTGLDWEAKRGFLEFRKKRS